MAHKMNYFC